MSDLILACTTPPYKADDRNESEAWLRNVVALSDDACDAGLNLRIFLAAEVDGRGSWVHHRTVGALRECGVPFEVWHFMVDDGSKVIDSKGRLHRICAGRNLAIEYALREGAEWLFHVDSDLSPDPESITKLLALKWPVVGGEVPTYCLSGPEVRQRPHIQFPGPQDVVPYDFPVQSHWNTAGYLLLHRYIFSRIRWGHDDYRPAGEGLTDDPWTQDMIYERTKFYTLVRKDCVGQHRGLIPMEERGHDRAWRALPA